MITYLYWIVVFSVVIVLLFFVGFKNGLWKYGFIASTIILIIGTGAYFFHFQQVFVKKYGGVMTLSIPEGQRHIGTTWKDENMWIENYDPKTNICYFTEYSKGNILQGKVIIKNCNPLMPQ